MIKEVKYNGYSASPSDYECADGDLAMSFNTINEDGAMRSVLPPKEIFTPVEGFAVKCIHEMPNRVHYIQVYEGFPTLLSYTNSVTNIGNHIHTFMNVAIYQITPIGNTLVVLTSDGMYYFLWKEDKYISLGNELPELNVRPYISTNLMNTNSFKDIFMLELDNPKLSEKITGIGDNLDEILYPELCDKLHDETLDAIGLNNKLQNNIYEKVFSVNNPRSKTLKEKGYFFEPFYVRFAYRLYDGSHIRHTVPVLMVPMTWGKPLFSVIINKGTGSNNESTTEALFEPIYFASKLFADINVSNTISNWRDIITNIDIFVTEPLIDYTDNAQSLVSIRKLSYDDGKIPMKVMTEQKWVNVSELAVGTNEYNMSYYTEAWFHKTDNIGQTVTRFFFTNYTEISSDCYFAFDCSKYTVCSDVLTENKPEGFTFPNGKYSVYKMSDYFALNETAQAYAFKTKESISENDVAKINMYVITQGTVDSISGKFYIETKRTDGQSYENVLTSCNSFYKISELSISELSNNEWNGLISIIGGTLNNLTTRQTLSDLGQGHNKIVASDIFSYNSRLNAIVKEVQFLNPSVNLKMQNCKKIDNNSRIIEKAYVEIYENSQTSYIEIPLGGSVDLEDLFYFTYPSSNAKNLYVEYEYGNNKYHAVIALKPHDFINQAYAFNMFEMLECEKKGGLLNVTINEPIRYGNIIRLSDVNNPFRFSEEYTVSLPVDEVYALSTAAKALSQGQFGQYPLYAFTSDGIWALEITSTGTYSARQPISRDIVVNKNSITQLDSAVLFVTQRGVMLLSGSNVTSISDKINTEDIFDITELPKVDRLVELYNNISLISDKLPKPEETQPEGGVERSVMAINILSTNDIKLVSFEDFIKNCRMLYDYPHQHLIVYNPNIRYAYVYSFKSQLWGMMLSNLKENVNSYPEALAMTNDNRLVDFSQYSNNNNKVLLITRPFKMDLPDVHKTISTIIQRGNLNSRTIAQVLYASNDMNNWVVVWSSSDVKMSGFRGTPYKYFRLAILRKLGKEESMRGFSVQYDIRLTNRLR